MSDASTISTDHSKSKNQMSKHAPSYGLPTVVSVLPGQFENLPDYTPKQTGRNKMAHLTTERKGFNPKTTFSKLFRSSNFVKFHNKLMAYFIQQRMGYIDDKQFQEAYRIGGWTKAWVHLSPRFQTLTEKQFKEVDSDHIYAALLASIECDQALGIIQRHAHSHDGLMAWIDLHDNFDNAGNLQMKITQLLNKLQIPWSDTYPGVS